MSEDVQPRLILITGIMAAGKSAVAQALAEMLPQSVHLRGDVFRRMIVGGRAEMSPRPSAAARAQLLLRYRLAADAAATYLSEGFSVVYQDVILGDDLRSVLMLHRHRPLHVVVLCPDPEVVSRRAETRAKSGYGIFTPEALDRALRNETPRVGLWLDSSDLTITQTANAIFAGLDAALVQ